MSEKRYIDAQELLADSFLLGRQILESGFRPNFIVGVWRGGSPVGIAVQEFLDYFEVKTDHISVRTSHYAGIEKTKPKVRVHGLAYLIRYLNAEDSLLIVDDVFDSGRSVVAVIDELVKRTRRNTPHEIKIATPWYKPANNVTNREPDFYLYETDEWLVFPHELVGLTEEELAEGKPQLQEILQSTRRSLDAAK